jgi:LmbE family N-acetylglucosaminyl deacetylase
MTYNKVMERVVIVVPHGDDEAIGFAGAIQKHIQAGDNVTVIFARSAAPNDQRSEHQIECTKTAKDVLKYHDIRYLHIPEITISDNPLILFRALETALYELDPTVVYTTFWGDNHQDHQITYDCVSRLIRVWGGLKVKRFLVGEIASSTDQSLKIPHNMFVPNFYIKLSDKEFRNKINSLLCYTGELMKEPHPRSAKGLETLARFRGMECDSEFAEAFMCLRHIA